MRICSVPTPDSTIWPTAQRRVARLGPREPLLPLARQHKGSLARYCGRQRHADLERSALPAATPCSQRAPTSTFWTLPTSTIRCLRTKGWKTVFRQKQQRWNKNETLGDNGRQALNKRVQACTKAPGEPEQTGRPLVLAVAVDGQFTGTATV
ncbi:hypothetical protein KL942_003437 [Ogataea angusta]|uniref:Uncharacterized protein n=1 Tax=Pichia angusta TaxID=870730 RepID=A0ABQ7RWV3_PICAN|nr:hypothetical protein KL942_003437 [Ogataea angusta]KAG7849459.1 hypothetical protein KL940_003141 [Ogataea angusta]